MRGLDEALMVVAAVAVIVGMGWGLVSSLL